MIDRAWVVGEGVLFFGVGFDAMEVLIDWPPLRSFIKIKTELIECREVAFIFCVGWVKYTSAQCACINGARNLGRV